MCTGKPVEGPADHTSHSPPAQEQLLRSVELSQASGGVGGPALAEPQPQGGCFWYTGNATNYFLGKKKKKKEVLLFPLFSSAGSSRKRPTTDKVLFQQESFCAFCMAEDVYFAVTLYTMFSCLY